MMRLRLPCSTLLVIVVCVVGFCLTPAIDAESLPGESPDSPLLTWPRPPEIKETARPWTRWWWPGSAVNEKSLSWQLQQLATSGIGGVEITPIYGARGYEERYIEFLSPQWMAMLTFTSREARRMGMKVDMATGTGWPFGGPWVPVEDAAQQLVLEGGKLALAPTGQKVKRAAPGGEGWVLDPYSAEAIDDYLERFDEAFSQFPDSLIRSQFHDSFEYYDASGTEKLMARFFSLHGYHLQDWSRVLMDEVKAEEDVRARLKADYRTALDSLHQDYLREWNTWAHKHGWLTRNQSHGAPSNLLDLYAIADIPETEIFGSTPFPIPGLRREMDAIRTDQDLPEPLVSRMASSAAHVEGKPLVSCETATWLRDHWKVTLGYVKPELDRIFLDGINHVFYHGTVFSPRDVPWPGWLFYASTQFNPNNPWWEDFASLNAYVTRVQTVLQEGMPDNPVLLYWPVHDIWHDPEGLMKQLTVHDVGFITETATGSVAREVLDSGLAFDYISDRQIAASKVVDGKILTPGNRYKALVVPPTGHMPLETLNAILGLARQGATVVFAELPDDVPGLGDLEKRREQLAEILASLDFPSDGKDKPRRIRTGSGNIVLGDVSAALGEVPDLYPESFTQNGLDYIRRRTAEGWNYFIANLGSERVEKWIPLGPPVTGATLFDPLRERIAGQAATRRTPGKGREIFLQLDPGQSILLCTNRDFKARGPKWPYLEEAGDPVPLTGPWAVTFTAGGPVLPGEREVRELGSWTEWEDPELERFAGTARYSMEFTLPSGKPDIWVLDLGDVRESARVHVNGKQIGTAWSIPFRLRLDGALKSGRNLVEIEVTNTAANRIRDLDRRGVDWKIMHEINFVNIRYRPFDASGWKLQPAGLLGPVRLIPMRLMSPQE